MLRNAEFKQPDWRLCQEGQEASFPISHIKPFARGNATEPAHLTLACVALPPAENWLRLPDRFSPWFVLSHNLSTTSDISIWLCFGAFLSSPARSLRIHWPTILSPRTTPTPARRGQVALQALPAGYCLPPTGARSQRAASIIQYGTKPGDSCAQILGTHRATHVSWVVEHGWPLSLSLNRGSRSRQVCSSSTES